MAAAKQNALSEGLLELNRHFEKFNGITDTESVAVPGSTGRHCLHLVRMLQHLALIQEREIGALRLLVGDVRMPTPAPDTQSDNVIRPIFGGRKNDADQ